MRIQHNILAMNAYRNYTNNVSALGKNLEKLSSGYKINRAGDDAAGLAISEKMRAQISGLDAAQKNVKDGISLVKTAEGAMQEIQDMLNRMVTLSTQSANGTYDNEVDRAALQQEVDALREEINRIADSANFNGIKLLDGSLDGSVDKTTLNYTSGKNNIDILQLVADDPTSEVGSKTVLKTKASAQDQKASFEVELHNLNIVGEHGDTVKITIGDQELELTFDRNTTSAQVGTAGHIGKLAVGTVKADELATAIKAMWEDGGYNIGGQAFTATTKSGGLTFTQAATATNVNEMVEACKSVTVEFKSNGANGATSWMLNSTQRAAISASGKLIIDNKEVNVKGLIPASATATATTTSGGYKIEYNNGKLTITNTASSAAPASVKIAASAGTVKNATTTAATAAAAASATIAAANGVTWASGSKTVNGTAVSVQNVKITFYTEDETGQRVAAHTFQGTSSSIFGQTADVGINGVTYTISISSSGAIEIKASDAEASGAKGNQKLVYEIEYTGTSTGVGGVSVAVTATNLTSVETTDGVTKEYATAKYNLSAVSVGTTIEFNGTKFTVGSGGVEETLWKIKEWVEKSDFKDKYDIDINGGTLTVSIKSATEDANASVVIMTGGVKEESLGDGTEVKAGSVASGTWNIKTTNNKNSAVSGLGGNLASTTFKLNSGIVKDGNVLTIGKNEYTFAVGKNSTVKGNNVINLTDYEDGDPNLIKMASILLSQMHNDVFTIGYDEENPGVISIHEKASQTTYTNGELEDLASFDSLVFFNSLADETVTETTMHGTALNLQIGDTSDDYNQMKVSIGDMHTDAMGNEETSIADISVATSEDAQAAVNVIRDAINYVSSVRGQLGAYQNRLEHTQNNLSVMAENIQDAESTIRDTDVAEEMMSYVKNNILVQSAQAMLAQANQVPQGVLQLLG